MSYHAEAIESRIIFKTADIPAIECELQQKLHTKDSINEILAQCNFYIVPQRKFNLGEDHTWYGEDSPVNSELFYEDNWTYASMRVSKIIRIIAKYAVYPGFIRFQGEDGDLWGFSFSDGKVRSETGYIKWEIEGEADVE